MLTNSIFDIFIDALIEYGSITMGLFSIIVFCFINILRKKEIRLTSLLTIGLGGSAIPTGFLLVLSAYKKEVLTKMLSKMDNVYTYIAFAGVALIYIYFKTFRENL